MGHSVNDTGPPNPPSSCRRRRHTCPCLSRCGGGGGGMWALAWCGGGRCSSSGKVEFNLMISLTRQTVGNWTLSFQLKVN